MEQTINEVYELICEMIENAKREIEETKGLRKKTKNYHMPLVTGQLLAYTDIKILLETSGVLEDDK